jgi:hypothetical protein
MKQPALNLSVVQKHTCGVHGTIHWENQKQAEGSGYSYFISSGELCVFFFLK